MSAIERLKAPLTLINNRNKNAAVNRRARFNSSCSARRSSSEKARVDAVYTSKRARCRRMVKDCECFIARSADLGGILMQLFLRRWLPYSWRARALLSASFLVKDAGFGLLIDYKQQQYYLCISTTTTLGSMHAHIEEIGALGGRVRVWSALTAGTLLHLIDVAAIVLHSAPCSA